MEFNCHNTKNRNEAHRQDRNKIAPRASKELGVGALLQAGHGLAYQSCRIQRSASLSSTMCFNETIEPKEYILKVIKMPRPMRMVWGSAVAYWLSGVINPAFVAIAVMIALFIPILFAEHYSPDLSYKQSDDNHKPDHAARKPSTAGSRRLIDE
jgi:hypothetical protein